MKKFKETPKKSTPSTIRKIRRHNSTIPKYHGFLDHQVKNLILEIKTLSIQLKRFADTNEEVYRKFLEQLYYLKNENLLITEQLKRFEEFKDTSLKKEKQNLQELKKPTIAQLIKPETKNKEILDSIRIGSKSTFDQDVKTDLIEIRKQCENILSKLQDEQKCLDRLSGSVQESVWAHIFNSTLKPEDRARQSYSPGRWAIGYPCLYAMYRILGSFAPRSILELGLGQSTVMIGDYVAKNPGVSHTVVERSPEWVTFFTKENKLSDRTHIEVLDYDFVEFGGVEGIRIFKDFEKKVGGRKYYFVCIDAPWGFDMKTYSRIDVLRSLSANFLASSFVILIDDTNRQPETNMVKAMRAILFGRGIATAIGKYRGDKECTVICTEDLTYLTSM